MTGGPRNVFPRRTAGRPDRDPAARPIDMEREARTPAVMKMLLTTVKMR